ncbi:MAG: hypothetical protein PHP04_03220 [Bacteroidales bacterium]|nr:hypothetical protein [Bacteroidales bacterium]HNW72394.1 hypothetical protein [Bacteroidales bacterium]HPS49481.1 hypothetical protein [Bacteroidales bacterium]
MKLTKTDTAKFRKICIALSLVVLCPLQERLYYYKVQTVNPGGQQEVKT